MLGHRAMAIAIGAFLLCSGGARADDSGAAPEDWSLHAQTTFTDQYHPAFRSPYRGKNSLDPGSRGDETVDLTLFAGLRLWDGGEAYVDPEIDQGFGLSDTVGVAATQADAGEVSGRRDSFTRTPINPKSNAAYFTHASSAALQMPITL